MQDHLNKGEPSPFSGFLRILGAVYTGIAHDIRYQAYWWHEPDSRPTHCIAWQLLYVQWNPGPMMLETCTRYMLSVQSSASTKDHQLIDTNGCTCQVGCSQILHDITRGSCLALPIIESVRQGALHMRDCANAVVKQCLCPFQ